MTRKAIAVGVLWCCWLMAVGGGMVGQAQERSEPSRPAQVALMPPRNAPSASQPNSSAGETSGGLDVQRSSSTSSASSPAAESASESRQAPLRPRQDTGPRNGASPRPGATLREATRRAPAGSLTSDGVATATTQPEADGEAADGEASERAESSGESATSSERSADADAVSPSSSAGEARLPLTPELTELRTRLRSCMAYYYQQRENAATRSPWGLMHAAIAYGVDTSLIANDRQVNVIGWLCYNGSGRGQRLMSAPDGNLKLHVGPGYQGHEGQFLAILAQCRVRTDYPMKVEGQSLTVQDLIEYEKRTCKPKTELTFKLIGLAHYLDSDATWENDTGSWSISRLIAEELVQPVIGSACGGTHRLMGFSYAVRKRQKEGKPLDGEWARAKEYLDAYVEYTFGLQNADGSFSTNWFESRGDSEDIDRRLQTTGHVLEWLVYVLPEERLGDPRVVKGIDYLTTLMLDYRRHSWEVGPKGHAIHALALYDQRAFGRHPGSRQFVLDETLLSPALPLTGVPVNVEEREDDQPVSRRRRFSRR